MYAQFFGNYLLSRDIVTKEQLIQAMQKKSSERIKLGTLAMHAGYMTADEVERVRILQTHQDQRFGELAIAEGYLTEEQVNELIESQTPDFLLLGQALMEDGILDTNQFQDLILDYESDNELSDFNYSSETKDDIHYLLEKFLTMTDATFSTYEISYLELLLNNLIRFIGDDFTIVTPYLSSEYPTNYCASQIISGPFSLHTHIDMPENVCIEFASRYAREEFTEFDEYVQASVEDFLNLHNGLFNVNLSNTNCIELELAPPSVQVEELLTFPKDAYLLPIIYPFGTIHFVLGVAEA